MRSKVKTYTLFGLTLVVTTLAILGVATGLILTDNRGPGRWPQLNHFQTVWYCLVLSFVGIQSIIIQATPDIESGPSKVGGGPSMIVRIPVRFDTLNVSDERS